jgi:short-subunit dehydrogenase
MDEGRVLITGASYGLGYELAKLYARDGHDLVLVARSRERLEALAAELRDSHAVTVTVIDKDLARHDAARELFEEVREAKIDVDTLVNNAGFGTYGRFSDTDLGEEERELQLNMITPTQLTKLFLPGMIAKGRGHIVNMASMAAFMPGPYMTIYFATKAYLLSFSESINQELKGSGVTVTAVCPNVVETRFQQTARNQAALIGGRIRQVMSPADKAAALIYREVRRRKRVVIPGLGNKLAIGFLRLVPHGWMLPAIAYFNRGPDIPPVARPGK